MISRLFWDGDEVCRNEQWLKIMKDWSVNSVIAAFMINMSPGFARPFIRRLSPIVRRARDDYQAARHFVEPLISARRETRNKARESGVVAPMFNDIVDWIDSENEEGACDPVALQMVLNVAAVHTTGALVTNTLTFLASNPHNLDPLRQEIRTELQDRGCQSSALNNLKLLDSALKESLRLKPPGVCKSTAIFVINSSSSR
jgi:cytochrome P450